MKTMRWMSAWGVLLVVLSISTAEARPPWAIDLYDAAGTISVRDARMGLVGGAKGEDATIKLTVVDLIKYTGHLCAGGASGFMVARAALTKLFPEGVVDRGQLTAVVSEVHDVSDVLAYVIGARLGGGEVTIEIDPKLALKNKVVMVLTRKDTKALVKAVWSMETLFTSLPKVDRARFVALKKKVKANTITPAEETEFGRLMQVMIKAVLTGAVVPYTIK